MCKWCWLYTAFRWALKYMANYWRPFFGLPSISFRTSSIESAINLLNLGVGDNVLFKNESLTSSIVPIWGILLTKYEPILSASASLSSQGGSTVFFFLDPKECSPAAKSFFWFELLSRLYWLRASFISLFFLFLICLYDKISSSLPERRHFLSAFRFSRRAFLISALSQGTRGRDCTTLDRVDNVFRALGSTYRYSI